PHPKHPPNLSTNPQHTRPASTRHTNKPPSERYLDYAEGDEPPPAGQPDEHGRNWLVLRTPDGAPQLAFQQVTRQREPDWPDGPVPQQMHLDLSVASLEELHNQHERVLTLGGSLVSNRDRPDPDDEERFRVYRDPEGHPFCIFVAERDE
ncbi:VOC family protein, partial [Streptomyces coeruleorubidus]